MEPRSQRLVTEAKIDTVVDASVAAAVPGEVTSQVQPLVAQAIVDSVIEAHDPLQSVLEPDISFAVVDEDGRRTWLEAGPDGGPTAHSAGILGAVVGGAAADAAAVSIGVSAQNPAITGLAFAVVDEDERRTDLELGRDGRLTQRVIDSLTERIGASLTDPLISGPGITCNGDSLTQGAGGGGTTWPNVLASLTGQAVTVNAQGGDGAERIAARQGGLPLLLYPTNGVIPATGDVGVTLHGSNSFHSWTGIGTAASYMGTLAGVRGRLVKNDTVTPHTYTFSRTVAGDPVTLPTRAPQPFYTDAALGTRGDLQIHWSGSNYPDAMGADAILAYIRSMTRWQSGGDQRFLVLSPVVSSEHHNGTTSRWPIIVEVNRRLEQEYGRRFINVFQYLREHGLADAGITPTAEDDAAYAAGVLPASLRTDSIHLTGTGYTLVANHVHARLREMGWA